MLHGVPAPPHHNTCLGTSSRIRGDGMTCHDDDCGSERCGRRGVRFPVPIIIIAKEKLGVE